MAGCRASHISGTRLSARCTSGRATQMPIGERSLELAERVASQIAGALANSVAIRKAGGYADCARRDSALRAASGTRAGALRGNRQGNLVFYGHHEVYDDFADQGPEADNVRPNITQPPGPGRRHADQTYVVGLEAEGVALARSFLCWTRRRKT